MASSLKVVGIVLNVLLAGLGFLLAPSGKKTQGIFWFGLWLIGNLLFPILFSMETNTFSLFWSVIVNIWSAVTFSRLKNSVETSI